MNKNDESIVLKYLSEVLADTYVLYIKTQNFHWNIEDRRFYSLHKLFEEQYEELVEAVDVIAERIRSLGYKSPASMKEFLALTNLKESSHNLTGDKMIKTLYQDNQYIVDYLNPKIEDCTNRQDNATADLFIDRLRAHDKAAWMLRSHLH